MHLASGMSRIARVAEAFHALGITVWAIAVGGSALAAAVVFPQMKALAPSLPGYAAYTGDHWMIAAGHVGRKVFEISDWVELGASAVVVVALASLTRCGFVRGWWGALRWMGVGLAAGLAIYNGLVLAPRMDRSLVAYWEAARDGRNEEASAYREMFSAEHPLASRIKGTSLTALLLTTAIAAAARKNSAPPPCTPKEQPRPG